MKIIKRVGKFRKTCRTCKTEFEFTKEDVRIDWRDKPLVDCPECGTEIFLDIKI